MSDLAASLAAHRRPEAGVCVVIGVGCALAGLLGRGLGDLSLAEVVALSTTVATSSAAAALLLRWLVPRARSPLARAGVAALAIAGAAAFLLVGSRVLLPPPEAGASTLAQALLVVLACLVPWVFPLASTPSAIEGPERTEAPVGTAAAPETTVSLAAQLQPHFLFNTLHSVSTLMHHDIGAADRMLARLGDLLRRTTAALPNPEVTLGEELSLLEPYLDILRIRFADRLSVLVEVEPAALDLAVPTMVLQPLVENAVRHGIARSERGEVRIGAELEVDALVLTVRNTGPGLPPGWQPGSGGVGLSNTRARLRCLYGSDRLLSISSQRGGGLAVTLRIPLRTSGHERSAPSRTLGTAAAGSDRR